MKLNLPSILVLSSLLTFGGCGKSGTGDQIGRQVIQPIVDGVAEAMVCLTVGLGTTIGNSFAADYDIKLYRSTIDRVVEDIKSNPNFTIKNFWAELSPDVRDLLNHEVNLLLAAKPAPNAEGVYRSLPIFFSHIKDKFDPSLELKIKDLEMDIYSFKARGQTVSSLQFIGLSCDNKGTDLSFVELPTNLYRNSEIHNILRCKAEKGAFTLMEVRDVAYLMAGKTLHKLDHKQVKKIDSKRVLEMTAETSQVNLKLKIRKKREYEERELIGRRTRIELKLPELEISELGACTSSHLGF
jgi:hypothetical protein